MVQEIVLGKKRLFKISHGLFVKKRFQKTVDELSSKAWICMAKSTGRGQGEAFLKARTGDYVYVCDGGNELWHLVRIASAAGPLPKELAREIGDENKDFLL